MDDDSLNAILDRALRRSVKVIAVSVPVEELAALRSERDSLAKKLELYDYMEEVAKANGYDCLTDAITKANAYGKERDSLVEQLDEIRLTARRWYVNGVELRAQLAAATGVIEAAKAHYAFHRPEEPMHCGVCRAVYALSARPPSPPVTGGVK